MARFKNHPIQTSLGEICELLGWGKLDVSTFRKQIFSRLTKGPTQPQVDYYEEHGIPEFTITKNYEDLLGGLIETNQQEDDSQPITQQVTIPPITETTKSVADLNYKVWRGLDYENVESTETDITESVTITEMPSQFLNQPMSDSPDTTLKPKTSGTTEQTEKITSTPETKTPSKAPVIENKKGISDPIANTKTIESKLIQVSAGLITQVGKNGNLITQNYFKSMLDSFTITKNDLIALIDVLQSFNLYILKKNYVNDERLQLLITTYNQDNGELTAIVHEYGKPQEMARYSPLMLCGFLACLQIETGEIISDFSLEHKTGQVFLAESCTEKKKSGEIQALPFSVRQHRRKRRHAYTCKWTAPIQRIITLTSRWK